MKQRPRYRKWVKLKTSVYTPKCPIYARRIISPMMKCTHSFFSFFFLFAFCFYNSVSFAYRFVALRLERVTKHRASGKPRARRMKTNRQTDDLIIPLTLNIRKANCLGEYYNLPFPGRLTAFHTGGRNFWNFRGQQTPFFPARRPAIIKTCPPRLSLEACQSELRRCGLRAPGGKITNVLLHAKGKKFQRQILAGISPRQSIIRVVCLESGPKPSQHIRRFAF